MRASVLLGDALLLLPAVLLFAAHFDPGGVPRHAPRRGLALFGLLLQPALILVDHGHFQYALHQRRAAASAAAEPPTVARRYNGISLGLALAAALAIGADHDVAGSILFCLSLNFKQMSLYYAPAFFCYLLGKSVRCPCPDRRWPLCRHAVRRIGRLAVAVVATFAACWLPWLDSPQSIAQVLARLFPVARGLFEDKVANVWCTLSLVWKAQRHLDQPHLLLLSYAPRPSRRAAPLRPSPWRRRTVGTLVAMLPACAHLLWRPSPRGLIYAMTNSALSFFLLSFQVHEKSILLPLMPASALLLYEPSAGIWFAVVAAFRCAAHRGAAHRSARRSHRAPSMLPDVDQHLSAHAEGPA